MTPDNDTKRSLQWEGKDGNPKNVSRTNHLLVIGIDEYKHHPRLNNARRDAETFRDILLDRYQFEKENVTEVFDEQATLRNILIALGNLEQKLTPTDNLVIYFSGHGSMNRRKTQGFWVPAEAEKHEADYIANDRVRAILGDMEAHHIYLIVDACFSGSMILRSADTATQLLEQYPSRRVLTSGRQQEAVSDGRPGDHSPFFSCIRQQLLQPSGGVISALELENHVINNTPRSAFQLPEAAMIFGIGDQSGKFVFYPKKDETRDWEEVKKENSVHAYKQYIQTYPNGRFVEDALWAIAQLKDDKPGYRKYIDQYPAGKYAREALARMDYIDQRDRFELAKRRGEAALRQFLLDFSDGPFAEKTREEIARIVEAEKVVKDETPEKYFENSPIHSIDSLSLPKMVQIPAGTFYMGSNEGESDEKPVHSVTVKSFFMGVYEVTVEEFEAFVLASGYQTDAEKDGGSYFWVNGKWEKKASIYWKHDAKGDLRPRSEYNHPVIHVSWNDAQAYCKWLSGRTGLTYRLPTEAEWEYAAGNGSDHTRYSWGNGDPSGKNGGNVADESKSPSGQTWATKFTGYNDGYWFTAPVGQYNPNTFGLYDMTGNVNEWCQDWYHDSYTGAPSNGSAWESPAGSYRVFRGGSWSYNPAFCRVALRGYVSPADRYDNVGFRLARTP
ncbi:MAG: SUMF1/EgtB/PvdO family nonheme iron enzyme [Bacteroidia bacterium]